MALFKTLIGRLDDAVNAWLPAGYVFGYSIPHDVPYTPDDPRAESEPEDLTHVDLHSGIRLTEYRQAVMRYGQSNPGKVTAADVTALPATGRYIIAEIVHQPTGIVAFRAYSYDAIRDLITGPGTLAQKRTTIRNQLGSLLTDCQARVAAAGGG